MKHQISLSLVAGQPSITLNLVGDRCESDESVKCALPKCDLMNWHTFRHACTHMHARTHTCTHTCHFTSSYSSVFVVIKYKVLFEL